MTIMFPDKKEQVKIEYRRHDSNNMQRCHKHDYYELYFLAEGERYLFCGGKFYNVREGDVFLVPPEIEHRTLDSGCGKYARLTCMIPYSLLPVGLPREDVYLVRPSGDTRARFFSLLNSACSDNAVSAYAAAVEMLSLLLSLPEYREGVASPTLGRMSEILDYIEAHYTERLTLGKLSERFFISEYYLCRLFRAYTGTTIMGFITRLRISKACLLLETGSMKINEIGKACGFGSVSAFGAAFAAERGISPREYRRRALCRLDSVL